MSWEQSAYRRSTCTPSSAGWPLHAVRPLVRCGNWFVNWFVPRRDTNGSANGDIGKALGTTAGEIAGMEPGRKDRTGLLARFLRWILQTDERKELKRATKAADKAEADRIRRRRERD